MAPQQVSEHVSPTPEAWLPTTETGDVTDKGVSLDESDYDVVSNTTPPSETPLPKLVIFCLFMVQFCEAFQITILLPFAIFMVLFFVLL